MQRCCSCPGIICSPRLMSVRSVFSFVSSIVSDSSVPDRSLVRPQPECLACSSVGGSQIGTAPSFRSLRSTSARSISVFQSTPRSRFRKACVPPASSSSTWLSKHVVAANLPGLAALSFLVGITHFWAATDSSGCLLDWRSPGLSRSAWLSRCTRSVAE